MISSLGHQKNDNEQSASSSNITLLSLPTETLIIAFTYLDIKDVKSLASAGRSCAKVVSGSTILWKELAIRSCGTVVEEVFHGLRSSNNNDQTQQSCVPNSKNGILDDASVTCLDDATLWKRCLQSRTSICNRKRLQAGLDYHLVTDQGFPANPINRPVTDLTSTFRFVLHVWNKDGTKTSIGIMNPTYLSSSDCIRLGLGGTLSSLGEQIGQRDFEALEIDVIGRDDGTARSTSSVVYSSSNQLGPYGGGAFEEYSGLPWLEWYDNHWQEVSIRLDWLPFVELIVPPSEKGINSKLETCIWMKLHWRTRRPSFQVGDDYGFAQSMTAEEMYRFLMNRTSTSYRNHSNGQSITHVPHYQLQIQHRILLDYTPQPLGSYSFILDIKNIEDDSSCSIFYETLHFFGGYDDPDLHLEFEISQQYSEKFCPWAEDYYTEEELRDGRSDIWVEIDKIFTVYVIDKRTGRQALLYESETLCQCWEYWLFNYYVAFEKSAALTQFHFGGLDGETIPVPSTHGWIHPCSREEWEYYDEHDKNTPITFDLHLKFLSYRPTGPGTGQAASIIDHYGNHFLTFLEKGLIYK